MDCENYEALVVDLLYGELSPERRADASAHAASCAECGKLSRELDEARKSAASLPARIVPPRELDERILLAARAASDVRAHPFRGSALHVAAAAVLAMLLVGVSFAVGMRVGSPKAIGDVDDEHRIHDLHSQHSSVDVNLSSPPTAGTNGSLDDWRPY